jgi:hypothetical protein
MRNARFRYLLQQGSMGSSYGWTALAILAGFMAPKAAAQDVSALTGENAAPLQVSGFGVGDYSYSGRTRANSFGAGKLAASFFRELSGTVWVFGQVTAAVEPGAPGQEPQTRTEIDNLIMTVTPPGLSSVSFSFGKLDAPIGFERDDEPLNLQPTTSFNFSLARPAKMVGLLTRWNLGPRLDLAALVSNGWDADVAPNHGKTAGLRVGARPSEGSSFGISALLGSEGPVDSTNARYLVTFDYALQPSAAWILAGEANWGGDRGLGPTGGDAKWAGGTLTLFRQLSRHVGLTARGEVLRDRDGARTGQPQTLTSYSFGPLYFVGVGREGIFANIEHTTFRIPRFQVRGEARLNHSTAPFFDTASGLGTWSVEYRLQAVATF